LSHPLAKGTCGKAREFLRLLTIEAAGENRKYAETNPGGNSTQSNFAAMTDLALDNRSDALYARTGKFEKGSLTLYRYLPYNGEEMSKGDFLGEFEQLILTGLMLLGENAYGATIHERMEQLVDGKRFVSLGAVYTTLDRLERKGYVKSWVGGATAERGGRSKRFFKITATGEAGLKNSLHVAGNLLREFGYAGGQL
jgi:PadR family transcriptional regulator PadR